MGAFAWVTLATNDSYSLGALVLAHSLKQAGTVHQLAVLVTPGVTSSMREKLALVFNLVQEVNILDSRDEANLKLLKRPELGITFTKLHCWRLTQFDKCVFLDADTLVLQNADELFEREELSAAPDVGWPDCFNSGVFVYRPSLDTFGKLIDLALEKGSFDGGDQGLLNLYFSDWAHKDISKHLPFIYNMCSTACYSYLPAFKQFGANAKIIHFIGVQKPWLQYFNTETKKVQPSGDASHLQEVLQRWWDIFCSLIHPHLSPAMAGLAGAFSQLTLGVARTPEQDALENVLRKQAWEVGNIDYLGKDSFANIWSKITETLSTGPEPVAAVTPASAPPAPAESQSQTAPVEEVKPVQPEASAVEAKPDSEPAKTEPSKTAADAVAEQPIAQPSKAGEAATEPPKAETASESAKAQPKGEEKPLDEPLVCPLPPKKEAIPEPTNADAPKDAATLKAVKPDVAPDVTQAPIVSTPTAEATPVPAATETPAPAEVAPIRKEIPAEVTPTPIASEVTPTAPTEAPAPPTQTEATPAPQETPAPTQTEITPAPQEIPTPTQAEATPAPQEIPTPKQAEATPAPQETLAPAIVETTPIPQGIPTPAQDEAAPAPQGIPAPTQADIKPAPKGTPTPTSVSSETAPVATETPAATPTEAATASKETPAPPLAETTPAPKETPAPAATPAVPTETLAPVEATPVPTTEVPACVLPNTANLASTVEKPKAQSKEQSAAAPQTKVTEATPPVTPGTPPVEKAKQALTAEASVPGTPPPSEAGATPTPPPRKTDKPKKAAAKPKK